MLLKALLVACLVAHIAQVTSGKSNRCISDDASSTTNEVDKECNSSEYTSYVDCIRRRSKRQTDCNSTCDDDDDDCEAEECGQCDCNYCSYNDCDNQCDSCCSGYQPPCSTRTCCHATCQSTCRTSSCRRGCRSRCHKSIEIIKNGGSSGSSSSSTWTGSSSSSNTAKTDNKLSTFNQAKHNITTVINLKTVVNNTNIVDMPVVVNNTNLNNVSVPMPQPGEIHVNMQSQPGPTIVQYPQNPQYPQYPQYPPQYPQQPDQPGIQPPNPPDQPNIPDQPSNPQLPPITPIHPIQPDEPNQPYIPNPNPACCNLVSPRQCVPTNQPPYSSCYHTKSRICGEVCTSSIMHAEPHRVCDQQPIEHHQQYFEQQNCHEQVAYIPQPQPRCYSTSQWPYVNCRVASPNCGGCYTHIVQGGSAPSSCPNSCYEGGVDVGPSYRPGPVYQPNNFAIPTVCGPTGCFPSAYGAQGGLVGAPGAGGGMNTWALESSGATFDNRPYNASLITNNWNNEMPPPSMLKFKRHSAKESHHHHKHEEDPKSLEVNIEEYPIKMD